MSGSLTKRFGFGKFGKFGNVFNLVLLLSSMCLHLYLHLMDKFCCILGCDIVLFVNIGHWAEPDLFYCEAECFAITSNISLLESGISNLG